MEGAGEEQPVALVVAADLHPAVSARIKEDVDLVLAVAHQDDRLFAHARLEEVAWIGDQALVPDKQPGPREDLLLLLLVKLIVDKDLAANGPSIEVHHAV